MAQQSLVTDMEMAPASKVVTPNDPTGLALVIERLAARPDFDVAKLEKIIALQERILTHTARVAFNTAFAAMQGEIPIIEEKGRTNNGTYARLEDIIERVRPVLQKHGFTLSHRTEWPDQKTVRVIGILRHKDGHEQTSEFLSGADASGNKNAIQGLGSAVSYGRRYTTKDLLNIVTTDEDDDGRAAGQKKSDKEPPAGFDDWLAHMETVAEGGWKALAKAFNETKPEYRDYALKHQRSAWEALRTKAQKVKA